MEYIGNNFNSVTLKWRQECKHECKQDGILCRVTARTVLIKKQSSSEIETSREFGPVQ